MEEVAEVDNPEIAELEIPRGNSLEVPSGSTFDFELFTDYIKKSVLEPEQGSDDVDLENYLLAYDQLHNFFLLMGSAFQFVAVDVRSKIKVLKSYRLNEITMFESPVNFSTVKSMIRHEEHLLKNSKYVSGSRTLLRLHRGLDFVRKFLRQVFDLENDVKLSSVAREVYNQTLADYHGWVIKSAARVAMQFLPSRKELLNQISNNSEEKLRHILELFPDAIEAMDTVYDRVQYIYTVNKLLDLP